MNRDEALNWNENLKFKLCVVASHLNVSFQNFNNNPMKADQMVQQVKALPVQAWSPWV